MNLLAGIFGLFTGVVVSYYSVNAINAHYQFWDDQLPAYNVYKAMYAALIFTAAFSFTIFLFAVLF